MLFDLQLSKRDIVVPPPQLKKSWLKIIIAFVVLVAIRSLNQFFISTVVKIIPPVTFLALRAGIASLLFIPGIMLYYIFHNDEERRHFLGAISPINIMETIVTLWVMGITESTLPYVSYGIADISLPADVATVIISLSPLCSYGMGFLFHFYDKKLKKAIVTKKNCCRNYSRFSWCSISSCPTLHRWYYPRDTYTNISNRALGSCSVSVWSYLYVFFRNLLESLWCIFKDRCRWKSAEKKKLMHFLAGWEEMLLVF